MSDLPPRHTLAAHPGSEEQGGLAGQEEGAPRPGRSCSSSPGRLSLGSTREKPLGPLSPVVNRLQYCPTVNLMKSRETWAWVLTLPLRLWSIIYRLDLSRAPPHWRPGGEHTRGPAEDSVPAGQAEGRRQKGGPLWVQGCLLPCLLSPRGCVFFLFFLLQSFIYVSTRNV